MAQQPQGPFVGTLSALRSYSVEHFYSTIMMHHYHGQLGTHRPEDYKVHEVNILKRYLWIQHESLVFEIRHNPLPPGTQAHPAFFIHVDRFADNNTKSEAFDRVICSPTIPDLPCTMTLWTLQVTVANNLDDNPFNLLRLAALLAATRRTAPEYRLSHHNCFWHTSTIERAIREHVLPAGQQNVPIEDLQRQWFCFRRHRCLGRRMGIPTDDEINNINGIYNELLGIQGAQVQD